MQDQEYLELGAPGVRASAPVAPMTQTLGPPGSDVPPVVAARAKQRAAARAKRQTAYSSPEELVLAKTEQSLAPFQNAMLIAKKRVDGFGVLGRLQQPEAYAAAQASLDARRNAYERAQAALEQRQAEMLETARRSFEARSTPTAPSVSPSFGGVEMDLRHRSARGF